VKHKSSQLVRNFVALTADFTFFSIGVAFYDPFVVIPAFVKEFTGSDLLVGALSGLRILMLTLPQIWAASVLVARPRKKPLLVWSSLIGRLPILLLAVATLVWTRTALWAVLTVLSLSAALFFTSEGLNGISWPAIVGKVIPSCVRGRFFGLGQFLSSVGALGAGYVVRLILRDGGSSDPARWAGLYALAFAGMTFSLLAILCIREEAEDKRPSQVNVMRALRAMAGFLRTEGWLRRVVVAQLVLGTASAVFPFFVVRARDIVPRGDQMVGTYLVMQNLGGVAAALICGYLIDRLGSWSAIRTVTTVQAVSLLAVILARVLGAPQVFYLIAFFLLGFVSGSSWWSFNAYLLDMASEEHRPIYLATTGILTSPTFLSSILVGALFEVFEAESVFAFALALGVVGMGLAWSIPRQSRAEGAPGARAAG